MSSDASPLGRAVRGRRRELGLTQLELSELAGTSERFVQAVEAGKDTVQLSKVLDLLRVLGLGFELTAGEGAVTIAHHRAASR